MRLAILLLAACACLADDVPKVKVSGKKEVVGESRILVNREGSRTKITPIREYGEVSEDGICTFRRAGIYFTRNGVEKPEDCYQDAEMYENADPPEKQEWDQLKWSLMLAERRSEEYYAEFRKLLDKIPCSGDDSYRVGDDPNPKIYCVEGKWKAVIAATSSCMLLEGDEELLKTDPKIAEWWSKCR